MTAKELAEANIKLVYLIAHRYKNLGEFEELVANGMVGLVKAARNYQEGRVAFSTYACRCIENEIKIRHRFERNPKRYPEKSLLSLDYTIGDDDKNEGSFDCWIPSSEQTPLEIIEKKEFWNMTKAFIEQLDERERTVFEGIMIHGLNQPQISSSLGVTQSWVSRMLKKLKQQYRNFAMSYGF
jgi:RNA polymerase sporulation-specific sigma factor